MTLKSSSAKPHGFLEQNSRCHTNKDVTHKMPFEQIGKKIWQRIPHTDAEGTCGDCGVAAGQYHHAGCDLEVCPRCRGQAISCECTDAYLLESTDWAHDKVITNPDEERINYFIDRAFNEQEVDLFVVKMLLNDMWSIDDQIYSDFGKLSKIIHHLLSKAKKPLLAEIKRQEKRLERMQQQNVDVEEQKAALAKENHDLTRANNRLQSENDWMRICDKL